MVSVAKQRDEERPPLKQINLSVFEADLRAAEVVSERRERRLGNRVTRSDILREAIHRALTQMLEEEGVKQRR